jgi:hypothetical protein
MHSPMRTRRQVYPGLMDLKTQEPTDEAYGVRVLYDGIDHGFASENIVEWVIEPDLVTHARILLTGYRPVL